MFTITKENIGKTLRIRLAGNLEENASLQGMFGEHTGEVEVFTTQVGRINSVGVKAWMKFFSAIAPGSTKIFFEECSPAIVEQINLISNFCTGGSIRSVILPYYCRACELEVTQCAKVSDLKATPHQVPQVQCPKCGSLTEFNDVPEEYLGFLTRTP